MKLCFVFIFLFAGAALGTIEKRILGGQECKKLRQYHVKIESVQRKTACGGSLIKPYWVLTAAHCGEQRLKVTLGANYDASFFSKEFFKKDVQTIEKKQQFPFQDEEGRTHDIMLIKLSKEASAKLPKAVLPPPECTRPTEREQVQIGGWGQKDLSKNKPSKKLMCASTEMGTCGDKDKPDSKYHSDETTTMCASKVGVKSCYGDSGSAVEHEGMLYGIIVSNPVDTCANPIVMQDICFYRKWINKIMKEHD